jgi:hypothetical protein
MRKLRAQCDLVTASLQLYEKIFQQKFAGITTGNNISIATRTLERVASVLECHAAGELTKDSAFDKIQWFAMHRDYVLAEDIIMPLIDGFTSVASQSGKTAPLLVIKGAKVYFGSMWYQVLQDTFVHCINNSIDHGLETIEMRLKLGKEPQGRIAIASNLDKQNIVIEIEDDGQGLDLAKLRHKAVELDLLDAKGQQDDQAIAGTIFAAGVTTCAYVTVTSGRGVGLSAVREILDKAGATIDVEFTGERNDSGHRPFKFVIRIPHEECAIFEDQSTHSLQLNLKSA